MYFAVFKYHTKPPKCNQSIIFYHQISNFQSSGIRCKFCVFSFSSSTLMYMKNKQHKHVLRSLFHPKHNKYCSTFTINLHSFTHNHIYLLASKYILIPHCSCIPKEMFLKKEVVFVSKLHIY